MTNTRPIRRLAVLKNETSGAQPRRRHGVDCGTCPNAARCALRRAIADGAGRAERPATPESPRAA